MIARKWTARLIEDAEGGVIAWEALAGECLAYMGEADVADMAQGSFYADEEEA